MTIKRAVAMVALMAFIAAGSPGRASAIAGGSTSNVAKSWMVALVWSPPNENFQCGGVLIKPNYVLTAAHCLDFWNGKRDGVVTTDEKNFVKQHLLARIGSKDRRVAQTRSIVSVSVRSSYRLNGDIASLKLNAASTKADIDIAPESISHLWAVGQRVRVWGWGQTSASNTSLPTQLKTAAITVTHQWVAASRPDLMWSKWSDGTTCYKDSGGPVTKRDSNGREWLVGLTVGMAEPACKAPSYQVRIGRLKSKPDPIYDWIVSNT